MNILTLSLGRNILKTGSRERERMALYARASTSLHIIVLTRREHGYAEEVHEGNLHIYPTNSRSRFLMLVDALFIGRRIMKGRDVWTISAQDPFAIGLAAYLLTRLVKNARFHVQLHGDYFGDTVWGSGTLLRGVRHALARTLLTRACRVRVVSERIKHSLLREGVPEARITVLPIRPELERFMDGEREARGGEVLSLLMASRFAREKDIPLALRAWSMIAPTFPHAHLTLIGAGSEETHIRALIKTLGLETRVTILPWTEHIEQQFKDADVFLLSSRHEAYGLTLIEALASGLPIVTTNVGCVGEVVEDGVHGIVVPVGDGDSFARALKRMLGDTAFRTACREACLQTARALTAQSPEDYAKAWVAAHSCVSEEVY